MADGEAIQGMRIGEHLADGTNSGVVSASIEPETFDETVLQRRGFSVLTPDQPMIINGQPYGFKVNTGQMAQLCDTWDVDKNAYFKLDGIRLHLGESLPDQLKPPTIEPATYNAKEGVIDVSVPAEIVSRADDETKITRLVERSIRRDILTGVVERAGRNSAHRFYILCAKAAMVLGPLVGSDINISSASRHANIHELASAGFTGAAEGWGVAVGMVALEGIYLAIKGESKHFKTFGRLLEAKYDPVSEQMKKIGPLIKAVPVPGETAPEPGQVS